MLVSYRPLELWKLANWWWDLVNSISEETKKTYSQIAINWIISQKNVVVWMRWSNNFAIFPIQSCTLGTKWNYELLASSRAKVLFQTLGELGKGIKVLAFPFLLTSSWYCDFINIRLVLFFRVFRTSVFIQKIKASNFQMKVS